MPLIREEFLNYTTQFQWVPLIEMIIYTIVARILLAFKRIPGVT